MKNLLVKYPGTLAIVWAVIIFILCATPGRFIPTASWLELLSFDKFVHAGIFFTLCALLFLYAVKSNRSAGFVYLCCLMSIAYGGLLELMQARYFSERSADWYDMIANTFGCIVALLFLKRLRNFYNAQAHR